MKDRSATVVMTALTTLRRAPVETAPRGRLVDYLRTPLESDDNAIRELAYFGRLDDAQTILKSLDNSQSDMALTYWGFTHRKMGNLGLEELSELPADGVFTMISQTCSVCHTKYRAESN